jgi:hypothetical protein
MENGKDKRLQQLLESYGADRTRWPPSDRGIQSQGGGDDEADARAVDRLLALASDPEVPHGAMARLLEQAAAAHPADVITFIPAARRQRRFIHYAAALPLAASLALGIYLGAQGSLDFMLPTAITGGVALNDEVPDDLGGVGDADAYAEENLT